MTRVNKLQLNKIEEVINKHASRNSVEDIKVCGYNFKIFPNVFSPIIAPSGIAGIAIACHPKLWKDKFVVELGSGSGIIACLISLSGAKKVLALDVNASAIKNTNINAKNLNIHNIEAKVSNVLDSLSTYDIPDIIYCDPPFCFYRKPKSQLERAFLDDKKGLIYKLLIRLKTDSRLKTTTLLLCTSSISDINIEELLIEEGISFELILTVESWAKFYIWQISKKQKDRS